MVDLPLLNTDTIWSILNEETEDDTVNQLVWHYLGYCYNASTREWDNDGVSEEWRGEYPQPPDFIAYRPPTMKLTRSIPKENKQLLKEALGFKGYKIGEFTPRQARRATMANWLLNYMKTHGIAIERRS
ncbi:MAG: DUF1823 family protein [Cyanobacteria bacterium SBLK]|nr:DUF1823 family protein [Cyanobacteria bacterium SBLK]